MKTIFASVPIGRCVKNFLHTDVYRELVAENRICIFSHLSKIEEFRREFAHPNVELYELPGLIGKYRRFFWSRLYNRIRLFNMYFKQKGLVRLKLMQDTTGTQHKKEKLAISFINLLGGFSFFHKIFANWLFKHRYYETLFSQKSPSLLILTTPVYEQDILLGYFARKKGIPIVLFPDSWDNVSGSNGEYPIIPDKTFLWSKEMEKYAKYYYDGFNNKNVVITGQIQFDEYEKRIPLPRAEFEAEYDILSGYKVITFIASSANVIPNEYLLIDEILAAIKKGEFGNAILMLRLNPGWNQEEYRKRYGEHPLVRFSVPHPSYAGGLTNNWIIEDAAQKYIDLLANSDVVLCIICMIIMEAAMLDTPIVNIGFNNGYVDAEYSFADLYDDNNDMYQTIYQTGGVKLARSFDELVEHIKYYLANPSADSEGRKKITYLWDSPGSNRCERALRICKELLGDS